MGLLADVEYENISLILLLYYLSQTHGCQLPIHLYKLQGLTNVYLI